jgi:hypothetical protein
MKGLWRHFRQKPRGILLDQARHCPEQCLERALRAALGHLRSASSTPGRASHRIPLGLLLLSREHLTAEQLRSALARQRAADRGRIGEWLQELGFATELQVTAALARQWSCPVLQTNPPWQGGSVPQIPRRLLESFFMFPLGYVSATSTLHLAFAEAIDYSVLLAIERMTGCRTAPCMAVPSLVRQRLAAIGIDRPGNEVVFDRVVDDAELCRIVRSYAMHVAATEIRLAACGRHLWVRLFRRSLAPMDLLLTSVRSSSSFWLSSNDAPAV